MYTGAKSVSIVFVYNILCQNYLAEPTVTNSTHKQDKRHCKRSVRQDGETIVIREKKELDPFSPLKSLDYYWLINIYFLLRNLFSNSNQYTIQSRIF